MPPPEQNEHYNPHIKVATDADEATLHIIAQADAAARWATDNEAHIVATYGGNAASGISEDSPAS